MLVPPIAPHCGRVRTPSVLLPRPLLALRPSRSLFSSISHLSPDSLILVSAILIYLSPLLPPSAFLGRVFPARILPSFLVHPFLSLSLFASTSTSSILQGRRACAHIILRRKREGGCKRHMSNRMENQSDRAWFICWPFLSSPSIFKGCSYDVRFLRGVARASAHFRRYLHIFVCIRPRDWL